MPQYEYGLKTGGLTEEEMIKIFETTLNRVARESGDLRISKGRKKMRKYTGPFGRSTPDAEPPEYDHIYFFNHRYCCLFLQLYPNREKNGRIKFPEAGIVWNLYVSIFDGSSSREMSDDCGTDIPEAFGYRFMRELFRTLPGEKVLMKEYTAGENRL